MKKLLLGSFVVAIVYLSGCLGDPEPGQECITELTAIVEDERDVDPFDRIVLNGIGDVFITQGLNTSLIIETHDELLPEIRTSVNDGELFIDMNFCTEEDINKLDIFIETDDIDAVISQGVMSIEAENSWDVNNLEIESSGVGDITLQGICNDLDINLIGTGNVKAFDMTATTCKVSTEGVGNVEVTVTDELEVFIFGTGNVSYRGEPEITESIAGLGQLIDAND